MHVLISLLPLGLCSNITLSNVLPLTLLFKIVPPYLCPVSFFNNFYNNLIGTLCLSICSLSPHIQCEFHEQGTASFIQHCILGTYNCQPLGVIQ